MEENQELEGIVEEKPGGIANLSEGQVDQIKTVFLKGMANYFTLSRDRQKQCIYLPLLLLRGYHILKSYNT
jgi:hypothetical protein